VESLLKNGQVAEKARAGGVQGSMLKVKDKEGIEDPWIVD